MSSVDHKTSLDGLYIVATPIGNLSDISLRALDVLKKSDVILCEDTRVSRKLMSAHDIKTNLQPYHDHNGEKLRPKIINDLHNGKVIALISDAGTPLISDPGYKLVKEVHDQGISVTPIPGASAFLAALSVSGLPTDKFIFLGFIPNKKAAAEKQLREYLPLKATQIYYETAPRLEKTLEILTSLCPEREVVVARELTKAYEEIIRGPSAHISAEISERDGRLKGEIVLLIAPSKNMEELSDEALRERITFELKQGTVSQVAKLISQECQIPRKKVYDIALKISEK